MIVWIHKSTDAARLTLHATRPALADQFPTEYREVDLTAEVVDRFFVAEREWQAVQNILSNAFYRK